MKKTKVFGIGFHKTGTTSLAEALAVLGYRVTGPNGLDDENIAVNIDRLITDLVPQFDAFQDNPWPVVFRQVDLLYPGSKFILTIRPIDEWIVSLVRHFGASVTPMRKWIYGEKYGAPLGNETQYRQRYDRHNGAVLDYFANRPGDLLVLNISSGDGWDKLCPYLGEEIPNVAFPHSNKASDRIQ